MARRSFSAQPARKEFGVMVMGGSGYTGAELIRLLAAHPLAKVPPRALPPLQRSAALAFRLPAPHTPSRRATPIGPPASRRGRAEQSTPRGGRGRAGAEHRQMTVAAGKEG